jgi:oligosaccharide repeat unit polymerase
MLNPFFIYAGTWTVVGVLYALSWSSYNSALDSRLLSFFVISVIMSLLIGYFMKTPKRQIEHERNGIKISLPSSRNITLILWIVAILDFAAQGGIPLFSQEEYVGFDIRYGYGDSVGIPVVHVLLVSFSMFYSFYLAYAVVYAEKNREKFVPLYLSLLVYFVLMGSRSYITYCVLALLMMLLNRARKNLRSIKVRTIVLTIIAVLMVCFLFGAYGNVRQGYSWNDSSYIQQLDSLAMYPDWLPSEFSWVYAYTTSTLANLNLNVISENYYISFIQLITCFLPTTLTKMIAAQSKYSIMYWDSHLNACTSFIGPYAYLGVAGLYVYFLFQTLYICFFIHVYRKLGFGESLGGFILSLFALLTCFYNPYTNVALCMAPWYLMLFSYLQRQGAMTGNR